MASHGAFAFYLRIYRGRIEKARSGCPSFALRAFDSKPPHGLSPFGHVANSSCPNHLQAFGSFVRILFQIFEQEVTEETEGLRAELSLEILISLALEL